MFPFLLAALLLPQAVFQEHTIATDLKGGYQVVVSDVNKDGKPDLIALASGMTELVWFENPAWKRHVLAEGLKRMINLAACPAVDEIVVASAFENEPARSVGIVSVLTPGADRTKPWSVKEIDRLTTSHRLRCADIDGSGKPVIVNAPLAGAAAKAPEYRDHVPLVYYRPGEWKRVTIGSEQEGVMHGIYITQWEQSKKGPARDQILTAAFSGIWRYFLDPRSGQWEHARISAGDPAPWPKSGASDIAVGKTGKQRFLASIEPWHGNQVAVYVPPAKPAGKGVNVEWTREVIDDSLQDGHTIQAADLDGDGKDEIVAGYRGPGRSVNIYYYNGRSWHRIPLDKGGIAAAACAVADLNGDGRPDIACIGSATTNLKWYENAAAGPANTARR
jgi:hypothetical protein